MVPLVSRRSFAPPDSRGRLSLHNFSGHLRSVISVALGPRKEYKASDGI